MSDKFRVLIVDDHQEIRTVLRANLETLDVDMDLIDVPTGEEAIIEVVGTGIDLLIADVGLPGLSGVELYRKLKSTYPDMQVIIITGLEDEQIRQEIAELGVEAFFFKPLKMPEFLNAVRITLGLEPLEEEAEDLVKLTKKSLAKEVTNRIADLRGELGAISIMVIEAGGVIGAETGILPDTIYETHVIPLLLKSFGSTNKISFYLGKDRPESTWYFSGEKYDVFWSHIDTSWGMVILTNPIEQKNDFAWVMTTVELAIQEVAEIIAGLGAPAAEGASKVREKKEDAKISPAPSAKAAKAKLPKKTTKRTEKDSSPSETVNENEVHEFWKAATLEEEIIRIDSPDSLSFEQAQKLGFIPNGDELGS